MSRKVVASFLRPFALRVRALGYDPLALARDLGLPDFEHGKEWVTPRQVRDFCDRASELTGDLHLGLHAAQSRPPGSFGLVEFAARCTPTLADALRFRIRYAALLHEATESFLEEGPTEARCGVVTPDDELGLGRHGHEFYVASGLLIIRDAIGSHWSPTRVWFSNPPVPKLLPLVRFFGTDQVSFDQPDNGIGIAKDDLQRPQRSADAPLLSFLEKQAQQRLEQSSDASFVTDLRRLLREQLERGDASMRALAERFHMSDRTLHRRLAAEGLTFAAVLDGLRKELAQRYAAQTSLTPAEMSGRLGYASLPAFLRAFKRWTGQSPTAYRQKRVRAGE